MKIKTMQQSLSAKGYFSLEKLDKNGVPTFKSINPSNNVITYEGAYRGFFSGTSTYPNFDDSMQAVVGTGVTEITRDSTGLGAPLQANGTPKSSQRNSSSETDNGDGTSTITYVRVLPFPLGAVNATISEVGLYNHVGLSGAFVAGQLIKDEFGSPTTLTVLSDEQLIVTYTLEITTPNIATVIGTGTVTTPEGPVDYTVWGQPFYASNIGSSNITTGVNGWNSNAPQTVSVYNSQGNRIFTTTIGSTRGSHDGSGTVTLTGTKIVLAPSSFSSSDIKFITVHTRVSPGSILDPSSRMFVNGNNAGTLVEFTPAISKSNSEALELSVARTITI